MSSLSQIVAYLFASGDAFFVGVALIVLGRAITWRFRQRRRSKWLRLLTVAGVIVLGLSVTPLPMWLLGPCLVLPLIGLSVPYRSADGAHRLQIIRRTQPLVELVLLIALATELFERHRLHAQPFERLPAQVHVIGDSISAGIDQEEEHLWPNLVASVWNIPVRNHAQAGATTASAFRQAAEIVCDDCCVLIEIGGNDLLNGRDSQQIAADLDRLLAQLSRPRRVLVMFELPLPPISGAYDLARVQRRLAHHHGVRLISRRDFASVLLTPGATSDGLHLSSSGHHAMARIVFSNLSPSH